MTKNNNNAKSIQETARKKNIYYKKHIAHNHFQPRGKYKLSTLLKKQIIIFKVINCFKYPGAKKGGLDTINIYHQFYFFSLSR